MESFVGLLVAAFGGLGASEALPAHVVPALCAVHEVAGGRGAVLEVAGNAAPVLRFRFAADDALAPRHREVAQTAALGRVAHAQHRAQVQVLLQPLLARHLLHLPLHVPEEAHASLQRLVVQKKHALLFALPVEVRADNAAQALRVRLEPDHDPDQQVRAVDLEDVVILEGVRPGQTHLVAAHDLDALLHVETAHDRPEQRGNHARALYLQQEIVMAHLRVVDLPMAAHQVQRFVKEPIQKDKRGCRNHLQEQLAELADQLLALFGQRGQIVRVHDLFALDLLQRQQGALLARVPPGVDLAKVLRDVEVIELDVAHVRVVVLLRVQDDFEEDEREDALEDDEDLV